MATTNQIVGGGFQDFEGNPLAAGWLVLEMSHDEQANSLTQIVAGLRIKIQLDTNGNIPTTPALNVWPNDVLLPAGSFYTVEAFRSDGTRAWRAPQYWTILSSPSPFNVGTLIPTNPPVAGATLGTLTLQTNGVNNGSQSRQNLRSLDGSITWTDNGTGDINAQVTTGTASAPYMLGAGVLNVLSAGSFTSISPNQTSLQVCITRFVLSASINLFNTLSFYGRTSSGSGTNFILGFYDTSKNLVWNSGSLFISNSLAADVTFTVPALTLSPGTYYLAYAGENNNLQMNGNSTIAGFSVDNGSSGGNIINQHAITFGHATNAATQPGGAGTAVILPATLGTLVAYGISDSFGSPYPMFEKV